MLNLINKLLTKNYTIVPLIRIDFNLKKYQSEGKKDSCMFHVHPNLANDPYIKNTLQGLVDYIRDSYDMERLSM